MNMKRIHQSGSLMLFSFLTVATAFGQSFQQTSNGIKAQIGPMNVDVQFYSPSIVRIMKTPKAEKVTKQSFSVIKTPEKTAVTVRKDKENLLLASDSVTVCLNLKTGKVSYADASGKHLLTEKDYGTQFTPVNYGNDATYTVRQAFMLDADEPLFGLGQQQRGRMNQRNQKVILQQENQVTSIPYIQSPKGYGVFWDNYSVTTFTDNPMETAFDSEYGQCADYYFLYGSTADNVVKCMRDLTGQAPMNPLWTYGFWQSRERYASQAQLLEVVRKYRDLKVPLDGIIQDWRYWGEDNADWNALKFNNPNFPDPKLMIDEVHRMNAHIAISVWPQFGKNTQVYQEFKAKNMLLTFDPWPGNVQLYDAFNPAARDIYWDYLNKNIYSLGMDAWWLDATEPEITENDRKKFDQPTYAGPFRKVANAFPLVTVGGVYEHNRKAAKGKRVYIFTRSAFAGQQRYGANSWSGDIKSSWEVLRNQISAGLNFSICGIPYWNTDIGGFNSCTYYPEGIKDPRYRELYVRWTQFGAFTPMMRSHGTCTPREIYQFGEKGSWEFDTLEKYIRLRYKMLPYMYSLAWDITSNGGSFMRALFMDFPNDRQASDINDQFMFGRSLLVAPVTEAMYVDKDKKEHLNAIKSKTVYLPSGTEWIDFWNGSRMAGGQTVSRETPIDILPLYVKAGSILPIGPEVQYAEEKKWDLLEIRVYPGANGEFLLYEDEFDNYNYEKGMYSTILFKWDDVKRTLSIGARNGEFPGMLKNRKFKIVIVNENRGTGDGLTEKADKTVRYSGKPISIRL